VSEYEPEFSRIFRLLTPKDQAYLLDLIYVAVTAENSVRKSLGFEIPVENVLSFKPQEYFCENSLIRSKK
jgi:hypothetical protein